MPTDNDPTRHGSPLTGALTFDGDSNLCVALMFGTETVMKWRLTDAERHAALSNAVEARELIDLFAAKRLRDFMTDAVPTLAS